MKCEEMQSVLLDYLTREMGSARAGLVREHLRKCEDCRRVASEIRATLELLHTAARTERDLPSRLSEERRARLKWAFMHPLLDWIYRHHIIVSMLIAAGVLAFLLHEAYRMEAWNPPLPPGITITIDNGPPAEGSNSVTRPDNSQTAPDQTEARPHDGTNAQTR